MTRPLFYFLAQHGPWGHHVHVVSSASTDEAMEWLDSSGKILGKDYEVIRPDIDRLKLSRNPLNGSGANTKALKASIFFFNDASLASYVKLKWGSS